MERSMEHSTGSHAADSEGHLPCRHYYAGRHSLKIVGTVSNGVFKGSCLVPSERGFGDIVSIEMVVSAVGKSISFRNIGANDRLRGLSGTRATRQ